MVNGKNVDAHKSILEIYINAAIEYVFHSYTLFNDREKMICNRPLLQKAFSTDQ